MNNNRIQIKQHNQYNEEEENMANRIPVEKKNNLISKYEHIIDTIYYLGNGFILTKQLFELLQAMGYGSSVANQMAISELLKNDVLTKKQALGTKNNILLLNAICIAHYTGENTKNIARPAPSEKTILNNIQKIDLIIQMIPYILKYYNESILMPLNVRKYFLIQGATYVLLPKDAVYYYNILNSIFKNDNLWGTGFTDDLSFLKVEHAYLVNSMVKYSDRQIIVDETDHNIYDMIMKLKESMSAQKICQEFWNFKNLMNTSCDINFIDLDENNHLEGQLMIYDNGNLCAERIAQISAWFFLMLDRYKARYQTQIHITVYINCLNQETLDSVMQDCNCIAEDKYGYSHTTRFQSLAYQQGLRFPYNTDNVLLVFLNSHITDKYNIIAN